jgi:hypothetical protein
VGKPEQRYTGYGKRGLAMTVRTRRLARWYREKLVTQRDQLDPTRRTVDTPKDPAKETVKEGTLSTG